MAIGDSSESGANERLLIVDDEPGITRLIGVAARDLGFAVMAINDTDQFEKALAALRPTIILLDVSMPSRDGLELIAHLAAGSYPGKVAIMSGTDPRYIQMSSAIATMRALNLAGTLAKPFRIQAVKELLANLANDVR